MNLIEEAMKKIGVKENEEFVWRFRWGQGYTDHRCKFDDKALLFYNADDEIWEINDYALGMIIRGVGEIARPPFKPKNGDYYWSVCWDEDGILTCGRRWGLDSGAYEALYAGNVFRTQEEAEAHRYKIYEKLTGKKWEEGNETTAEHRRQSEN